MSSDFIKVIREIRGDGEAEAPYTSGIYHDIAIKTTEDDGITPRLGAGIYGSMKIMHEDTSALTPIINELQTLNAIAPEIDRLADSADNIDVVAPSIANVDIVSPHVANVDVVAADIANVNTVAVASNLEILSTIADDLNGIDFNNQADIITVADDLILGVDSNVVKVSTDITNVNTTGVNIASVNTTATDIINVSTVATDIDNVNTTAVNIANVNATGTNIADVITAAADLNQGLASNIIKVSTDITNVNAVGTNIANVNTVATDIASVNTTAGSIADVNTIATNIADINSVATTVVPNIAEILLADDNAASATASATAAQLSAWEAEAERRTADSYATEPEDVFVNLVTSDGDGTFTYTPTTDYSALHSAAKALLSATNVVYKDAVQSLDATDALTIVDHTITLHKGDGTAESVTVPDNNTEYTIGDGGLTEVNFTSTRSNKLDGIEALATADQTKADIDALNINADTVDGLHGTDLITQTDIIGAIGNINNPLLDLPLNNSLAMKQGRGSVTFTRATTATYIDRYGVLQYAAIDEPRFESDGLLIEGASTNLLLHSNVDSSWIVANGALMSHEEIAPDGANHGTLITYNGEDNGQIQSIPVATTLGSTYTVSFWGKAGSKDTVNLFISGVASNIINLTTEWERYSVTFVETDTTFIIQLLDIVPSIGTVYIWGAQLEELPFASSYIPTTTAAVTRGGDVCSVLREDNCSAGYTSSTTVVDFSLNGINQSSLIAVYDSGVSKRLLVRGSTGAIFSREGTLGSVEFGSASLETQRVASVFNGSVLSMYYNGVFLGSSPTTHDTNLLSMITIGDGIPTLEPLFGHVKNFRIYDKALTDREIALA